jgi:Xaa-Pro aminopeptidase
LQEECPNLELEIRGPGEKIAASVAGVVGRARVSALAVEAASMSIEMASALEVLMPKVTLVKTSGLVEGLRMVKDKGEVARIREAAKLARRGFEVIRAGLRGEQSECDVAAELEYRLRGFGAKGCSFPSIVAAGARSALPHARPTRQLIGGSEFVLIDWGANEGLYVSDLTRLLVTGRISPKLQKVYGVVLKAQLAAIEAIRPGVSCEHIDGVARRVIERAGFGAAFGHGLGHGIGLEVHEGPRLSRHQPVLLRPGMVVTVEPGIYLPGWGGVRIEDDVLVTRGGHEVLTDVPKSLEESVLV